MLSLYQRELRLAAHTPINNAQSYDAPRSPLTRAYWGQQIVGVACDLCVLAAVCFVLHHDPGTLPAKQASTGVESCGQRHRSFEQVREETITTAQRFWNAPMPEITNR